MNKLKTMPSFFIVITVLFLAVSFSLIFKMSFSENTSVSSLQDVLYAERAAALDKGIKDAAPSPSPKAGKIGLEVTQEALGSFLSGAEGLPIEDVEVTLSSGGKATVTGDIKKSKLESMLKSQGKTVSDLAKPGLSLLPDSLESSIDVIISLGGDNGALTIKPEKLMVQGIALNGDMIPKELVSSLNDALNAYIASNGGEISSLESYDGGLKLELRM